MQMDFLVPLKQLPKDEKDVWTYQQVGWAVHIVGLARALAFVLTGGLLDTMGYIQLDRIILVV